MLLDGWTSLSRNVGTTPDSHHQVLEKTWYLRDTADGDRDYGDGKDEDNDWT